MAVRSDSLGGKHTLESYDRKGRVKEAQRTNKRKKKQTIA